MSRKSKKSDNGSKVNLTPMLDIVFILLIFFIVTATFVFERGMDVTAPQQVPPEPKRIPIIIAVDRDNHIFVEEGGRQRQVDFRAVRANVARRLAENPERSVIVQAHPDSDMGTVVRVMDQARQARNHPTVPVSVATTDP